MRTKNMLTSGALAALTVALPAPVAADVPVWRFHADHVLGTSLDVVAIAPDEVTATIAAEAARAEIARLDTVLSVWRDDSELEAFNRSTRATVSLELRTTLEAAARMRALTNGAFDERLGELDRAWRAHDSNGKDEIDAATLQKAVWAASQPFEPAADPDAITRPTGMRIALDGFAKGVIIDAALEAARRAAPGVEGLLVDIGGDLRCWGRAPNSDGWMVGIPDPQDHSDNAALQAIMKVTSKGVATSGRGDRDHAVGQGKVSHLLDPRSGRPVDDIASVTVLADRAADADALATAFSVMPIDESLALADGLPGVAASITTLDGAIRTSAQWGAWTVNAAGQQPNPPVLLAQNTQGQSGPAWPGGYALSVQYEVPEVSGGRYRRPYLAIWITDASGRPVRTVLLLGTRSGWQRGNYLWSRQYASRQPDLVDAVSRPTRAPGRYTAIWDGTDDAGRKLPQGTYTIHVEAVREYGGHSYGYADLELFDGATQREMRPREEFGGLRLVYGPAR